MRHVLLLFTSVLLSAAAPTQIPVSAVEALSPMQRMIANEAITTYFMRTFRQDGTEVLSPQGEERVLVQTIESACLDQSLTQLAGGTIKSAHDFAEATYECMQERYTQQGVPYLAKLELRYWPNTHPPRR